MAKKKRFDCKQIGNGIIILLSVFIGLLFVLNEMLDLGFKAPVIIFLTIILAAGLIVLSKKINISSYLLLPVIILDGFFHLTSPLENLVANSPDWILAFNFYGGNGMPVIVHQIMGILLLVTSAIFVYHLISKRKNWYVPFYKYIIAIITMTIISASYVIKLLR